MNTPSTVDKIAQPRRANNKRLTRKVNEKRVKKRELLGREKSQVIKQ